MDELFYWEHLHRVLTFSQFLAEEQCVASACNRMALQPDWGIYFVNEAVLLGLITVEHQPFKKPRFIASPERFTEFEEELKAAKLEFKLKDDGFSFF